MEQKKVVCKNCGSRNGYHNIIKEFEPKRDNLLPILHAINAKEGYLSEEAMVAVAEHLGIRVADVYGTASFYTLFSREPKGKYIIRLCDSPSCHIEGSRNIKKTIEKELGIGPGETTEDGLFTFEIVSCLGLCGVAPSVMINEDVYGNLTPESITSILKRYRESS